MPPLSYTKFPYTHQSVSGPSFCFTDVFVCSYANINVKININMKITAKALSQILIPDRASFPLLYLKYFLTNLAHFSFHENF